MRIWIVLILALLLTACQPAPVTIQESCGRFIVGALANPIANETVAVDVTLRLIQMQYGYSFLPEMFSADEVSGSWRVAFSMTSTVYPVLNGTQVVLLRTFIDEERELLMQTWRGNTALQVPEMPNKFVYIDGQDGYTIWAFDRNLC